MFAFALSRLAEGRKRGALFASSDALAVVAPRLSFDGFGDRLPRATLRGYATSLCPLYDQVSRGGAEIGCRFGGVTAIIGAFSASGAVVERYGYEPHGKLTILAAGGSTVRASSSYASKYTYTGRRWDADLSLYYSRARMHLPSLGRFSSRDPLGYIDGMSLYPDSIPDTSSRPVWIRSVSIGPIR